MQQNKSSKKWPNRNLSKERILFFSILIVSAIFSIAVFATHGGTWLISAEPPAGQLTGETGATGQGLLNQTYVNSQYTNNTINITFTERSIQTGIVLAYVFVNSTNRTGWNFTGTGGGSSNWCCANVSYWNGSTWSGGTSGALGTLSNMINWSGSSSSVNITIWLEVGMNFSAQGIYNMTMTMVSNHAEGGANPNFNSSNFSIVADFFAPVEEAFVVRNRGGNFSGNGTYTNDLIDIEYNISDWSLNVSNLSNPSATTGRTNITIFNSTNGIILNRSAGILNRSLMSGTNPGSGNMTWNFTFRWVGSGIQTNIVNWNYSIRLEAADNASNTMNVTEAWFIFDNITPNASVQKDILSNASDNAEGAIPVVSSLPWINGTATEFPGRAGYGPLGSASGIQNISVAIMLNNSSFWNNASSRWQAAPFWIGTENNSSANYTSGMATFINWYIRPIGTGGNGIDFVNSSLSGGFNGARAVNNKYFVIINVSDNALNNITQANSNATNVTFLFDNVTPQIGDFAVNNTERILRMNESAAFLTIFNDTTFNLSNVNLTLFNASTNNTAHNTYFIPTANHTDNGSGSVCPVANPSVSSSGACYRWAFRIDLEPNKSMSTGEYNYTIRIVASDNASNIQTSFYSSWIMFDNQSPTITSSNPANASVNASTTDNITLTFHEVLNEFTVNNTTVRLFKTDGTQNITANVTYENTSSNVGRIIIDPNGTLEQATSYTIIFAHTSAQTYAGNACSIADCVVRDRAGARNLSSNPQVNNNAVGNTIPSNYNISFTTPQLTGSTSSGGTGGLSAGTTTGDVVAENLVSEEKPVTIIDLRAGEEATFIVEEEQHALTIECNEGGVITILLDSNPIQVILKAKKPAFIDLNNDGIIDVTVTLQKVVSQSQATVKVEYLGKSSKATAAAFAKPKITKGTPKPAPADLVKKAQEAEEAPTAAEVAAEKPSEQKPKSSGLAIAVVVIIALLGLGYWFTQKKGQILPSERSL